MFWSSLTEAEERARAGAKWLIVLRLVLAVVAIAVVLIAVGLRGEPLSPASRSFWVYAVAVAACLLNLVYLFALRHLRGTVLSVLELAGDIVLQGLLVYFTGSVESPFVGLFFVSVIAASLVLSLRASLFFASQAVIIMSLVSLSYFFGGAPFETRWLTSPGALRTALAFHFAQSSALFLVAYLSGRLSQRLSATRLLAEEILGQIGDGVVALDAAGRLLYANPEASRIVGRELPRGENLRALLPREESEGLFPPEEMPGAGGPWRAAAAGKDLVLRRVAFSGEEGKKRGELFILSDRTWEAQLAAMERAAEKNQALAEMATAIAHELRNPLAALRGSVQEIARRAELSPQQQELLSIVLAESDRLERVISEFLSFARLRGPHKVLCSLLEVASDCCEILKRQEQAPRGVVYRLHIAQDMALRADREQLLQALLNLGLNALAAMDNSPRERILELRARRAHSEEMSPQVFSGKEGILLEFSDTGHGMSPEAAKQAFDPFFTTKPQGTGLGLSVVRRIVENHGGAITFSSRSGRGSTFRLWLPVE